MPAKRNIEVDGIPSVLWGSKTDKLFIAVHGDKSDKNDTVIAILAEESAQKGYQVLSFDLPCNSDLQNEQRQCYPKNCVAVLSKIMKYAKQLQAILVFLDAVLELVSVCWRIKLSPSTKLFSSPQW